VRWQGLSAGFPRRRHHAVEASSRRSSSPHHPNRLHDRHEQHNTPAKRPIAPQGIYGFQVAGFLITMGTLGDRIGRRKLLLIGAAAFAAASAIAALSRSAEMLIAMRALLGIAGATLAPSTMSLIRNMFHDEHERQFAIGIWIASFSLGGAIGPLVGGVLLQFFPWGRCSSSRCSALRAWPSSMRCSSPP
jgi:MFS family permease